MSRPRDHRSLRTGACLGVDATGAARLHAARAETLAHAAARIDRSLGPGGVALITGPSGAGKSTLLRLLTRSTGAVMARPLTKPQLDARVASLSVRTPLKDWTGLLARFGLSEAAVLVSRAGDLSAGEQARLQLALGAARCLRNGRRTLVVDEWCSTLDRVTAAGVATGAARWARERRVRLVGATAHGDLIDMVHAEIVVTIDNQGGVGWTGYGSNAA